MKLRYFFLWLASNITRKPRYLPTIEWSSNSVVHNVFRLFEHVFGRKYGIRPEVTAGCYYDEQAKKWKEYQVAHTFEASLAIIEGRIRRLFSIKLPYLVSVPNLQFVNGALFTNSPYRFAIAYDAIGESTTGFGTSEITWTHTTSGSDRVIFISSGEPETGGYTGFSYVRYNGVDATQIDYKSVSNATSDWFMALFGLVAPATGANTVAYLNSQNNLGGCSVSYTGVKQTGLPDSYLGTNSGGSSVTSLNCSTTVVASDCWLILAGRSQAGVVAAGTSTTVRAFGYMPTNKYHALLDSNGTVGTGSQTLQITASSGNMGGVCASFAPAGGGATVSPGSNLTLMGAG